MHTCFIDIVNTHVLVSLVRNLLFLKHHTRIDQLSLNFTVVNNDFGEAQVIFFVVVVVIVFVVIVVWLFCR